jgi:virulence-associated protein VagC
MSAVAKLFQNGGSQAVRLPRECRFPEGQQAVRARRVGRRVVLEPLDEWSLSFRKCLGAWDEEISRPSSLQLNELKDPFAR